MLVLGAGVDNVLHAVRIESMTHAGASVIFVEPERPLGRIRSKRGVGRDGNAVPSISRFKGVDLLGVCGSPRGVGMGFVGDLAVVLEFLVGVDGTDPEREGVPGAEPLAERFTSAELDARDRSRNPYSFLYARGGQGGLPSSGGNRNDRLSLFQTGVSNQPTQRFPVAFKAYLLHAISAHACGLAISSSGFRLVEKLRDCATRDRARLTSSGGRSLACVGSSVFNACSTGRLFISGVSFSNPFLSFARTMQEC